MAYVFYFNPKFVGKDHEGILRVYTARESVEWDRLKMDDLIDTADLMRKLQCSRATLYRYISQWKLTARYRVGNEMFFRTSDVNAWIDGGGRPQWGGARNRREVK